MRTKQTPVPARGLSDEDSDSEGDLEALEAWQGAAPHGQQPPGAGQIDSGGDSGRAHGAAPPQSGADGASPCAAVQQMGAHDGGEPGSAAAAEAEVEAEGEADACAAADAETEAVGIAWPMFQEFAVRGSHPPSIAVPLDMMRTCFPGAELPLEMRLRLEVDGHPWGQPFPSRINPSGHIAAGLRSFPELFGCRVIGLRRDTDSGGAAALTLLLSSLEDERHGDDERPVAVRITAHVWSTRRFSLKKDVVLAWWPDTPLPLDLTASFAVDGATVGQPLQVQLQGSGRHHALALRGPIPLALGSTITSIRLLSPSSIELRASTAATPGGSGAGVRAAGARPRPAGGGVKRRRGWGDSDGEEETSSSSSSSSSSSEEEGDGAEGVDTGSMGTAVPPPSRGSGQRRTAARTTALGLQWLQQPQQLQPPQQQPQPAGARLQALALRRIDPPPGGDALAEAGCTAMLEAQRAAEALGLEPALFAAVCCGMQQATEGTVGTRRFLAGDYPSLRYACGAGDAAVAREWMAHMAARGGR